MAGETDFNSPPPLPKRTRRRGEALERAILVGAWDELVEHGWKEFQVSRVASRTGTSKATIYQRWPSRASLVLASVQVASTEAYKAPPPEGDNLREDLSAYLHHYVDVLAGPLGDVLRAAAAEGSSVEDLMLAVRGSETPVDLDSDMPRPDPEPIREVLDVLDRHDPQAGDLQRAWRVVNLGPVIATEEYLTRGRLPKAEDVASIVEIWLSLLRA